MGSLFYRHPRFLWLFLGLCIVSGLGAFSVLPRREDPELVSRLALLVTSFPGASAERVENLLTEKLEDALDEIEEIKEMVSSSRPGISIISIELKDAVLDGSPVWGRVRDELADRRQLLPRGARDPVLDEIDIDASSLIVGLRGRGGAFADNPPVAILQRLIEDLGDELRSLSGTKETQVFGANAEEILIEARALQLSGRGLSTAQVAGALARSDSKLAAGGFNTDRRQLLLEVEGAMSTLDRVRHTPVQFGPNGEVTRVMDIAEVRRSFIDPLQEKALLDSKRGVVLAALIDSGQRVDAWTVQADKVLEAFEARLPHEIELVRIFSQNQYTAERLTHLQENLGIGASLVMAVVLLLMGWKSALIVGLALPLSTLLVLTGMRAMGIPIHQMSATGLVIAIGLLIDNAIVMVDEVRHRLHAGDSPEAAARNAVKILAIPLLGSTATTILAFLPIVLMPGPAGEFVGTISISVILALLSSLLLSLTVIPAVTARMGEKQGKSFLSRGIHLPSLTKLYSGVLRSLLRWPIVVVALAMLAPILGFIAAGSLTEQFFPSTARDQFAIEVRLDPQVSIAESEATTERLTKVLRSHESVEHVHWFIGRNSPKFYYNMMDGERGTPSYAQAYVQLDSANGVADLLRALQGELDLAAPEAQIIVKQLEQGPPFLAPVEIYLFNADPEALSHWSDLVRAKLATVPGVTHTRATQASALPKLVFSPDEERLGHLGLSRADIAQRLNSALVGQIGGSVVEGTEELPLRVRLQREDREELSSIRHLSSSVASGADWLPLSAFGQFKLRPVYGELQHRDGQRTTTVQAWISPGLLPATVMAPLQEWMEAQPLPSGGSFRFGGEGAKRDEAVGNLMASVGVLLVLMIAALVLSFSSFRLAGIIGLVGVLCIGLAMGALWIFDLPFGFMAIVGAMGLVGVAINDSIVVLAAIRDDASARTGDRAAVTSVVVRSTRHVVATTLTTAIGFTPLLLAGGGFWPPLVVTIAGGVMGATVLALFLVPALYLLVATKHAPPAASAM